MLEVILEISNQLASMLLFLGAMGGIITCIVSVVYIYIHRNSMTTLLGFIVVIYGVVSAVFIVGALGYMGLELRTVAVRPLLPFLLFAPTLLIIAIWGVNKNGNK